ncbi:MAG: hypothetical protein V7603_5108 [Micromonosporaceae bacterium]
MATADLLTHPIVTSCQHQPVCPAAEAIDREAARVVARYPEQGWSLLCNGVILFEDTGEILPDNSTIAPHRGPARHALCIADREVGHG